MGAGGSAWFGLFIGLLFGLFVNTAYGFVMAVLISVVMGAMFGAIFGFLAQWTTGGQRNFAGAQALVADRYDVHVDTAYAAQAATDATRA